MSKRIPAPQPHRPPPRDEAVDDTPRSDDTWEHVIDEDADEDPWAEPVPDDEPLDDSDWNLPQVQSNLDDLDAVDDTPLESHAFEPLPTGLPDLSAPPDTLLEWPWSSAVLAVELGREIPVVLAPHEAHSTWFGAPDDGPTTLTLQLDHLKLAVTPNRAPGSEGLCLGRDVLAGTIAVIC